MFRAALLLMGFSVVLTKTNAGGRPHLGSGPISSSSSSPTYITGKRLLDGTPQTPEVFTFSGQMDGIEESAAMTMPELPDPPPITSRSARGSDMYAAMFGGGFSGGSGREYGPLSDVPGDLSMSRFSEPTGGVSQGGYSFQSDRPISLTGSDEYPTPYQQSDMYGPRNLGSVPAGGPDDLPLPDALDLMNTPTGGYSFDYLSYKSAPSYNGPLYQRMFTAQTGAIVDPSSEFELPGQTHGSLSIDSISMMSGATDLGDLDSSSGPVSPIYDPMYRPGFSSYSGSPVPINPMSGSSGSGYISHSGSNYVRSPYIGTSSSVSPSSAPLHSMSGSDTSNYIWHIGSRYIPTPYIASSSSPMSASSGPIEPIYGSHDSQSSSLHFPTSYIGSPSSGPIYPIDDGDFSGFISHSRSRYIPTQYKGPVSSHSDSSGSGYFSHSGSSHVSLPHIGSSSSMSPSSGPSYPNFGSGSSEYISHSGSNYQSAPYVGPSSPMLALSFPSGSSSYTSYGVSGSHGYHPEMLSWDGSGYSIHRGHDALVPPFTSQHYQHYRYFPSLVSDRKLWRRVVF